MILLFFLLCSRHADRHGSVDEGIMDAMVLSELGKASRKGRGKDKGRGKGRGKRRGQEPEAVEMETMMQARLARNRSELQSFPTTTTMQSVLEDDDEDFKESTII
jgi:hypothetical protein